MCSQGRGTRAPVLHDWASMEESRQVWAQGHGLPCLAVHGMGFRFILSVMESHW